MSDFGFPKSVRLLRSAEFDRVFRQRCSLADAEIVVYACEGPSEQTRLGLTVSRKCGNAVARNRWKRALREAFRLSRSELPPGLDFIVLPQPRATPDVGRLQASLKKLCWPLHRRLQASTAKPKPEEAERSGGEQGS